MRRSALVLVALLAACQGGGVPDASAVTAVRVYGELVEAGLMAANDDSGPSEVAASHAAHEWRWMDCLYDGGTVETCVADAGDD